MSLKIKTPASSLIERTAAEFAATVYEAGRSQGMTSKHKTPKAYARANFEYYIPKALEILTDMLGRPDIDIDFKDQIMTAILERANDPNLAILDDVSKKKKKKEPLPLNWKPGKYYNDMREQYYGQESNEKH